METRDGNGILYGFRLLPLRLRDVLSDDCIDIRLIFLLCSEQEKIEIEL